MAGLATFASLLVAIRGSYAPPLYCEATQLLVIPRADRNPEDMEAHARRLESPRLLADASADPCLAPLRRPLRTPGPHEFLDAATGPATSSRVVSAADGTIAVEGMGGSEVEARQIADAMVAAYIRQQGAGRVARPATGRYVHSMVLPRPLSEPWQVVSAVVLAAVASWGVIVVPLRRPSRWTVAAAVFVGVAVTHSQIYIFASAVAAGVFALGGIRHPWIFLAVVLLLQIALPTVYDSSAHDLFTGCLAGGWLLGAISGGALRGIRGGVPDPTTRGDTESR
jgi:hypothetical protein